MLRSAGELLQRQRYTTGFDSETKKSRVVEESFPCGSHVACSTPPCLDGKKLFPPIEFLDSENQGFKSCLPAISS